MVAPWLITTAASLISGWFSKSGEEDRDRENFERWQESNARNRTAVETMNANVRARAEAAAALPIITQNAQYGGVDVKAMMTAAEAAGINPITWLRNGGMQAYSWIKSENRVWNSTAMEAALAGSTIFQEGSPPQSTARSTGEVLGSAISSGASQWVHEVDQQRQNDFQMALMNAQLVGAQQNRMSRSGYVPTAILAGGRTTSATSAQLGINPRVEDYPSPPTLRNNPIADLMSDIGQYINWTMSKSGAAWKSGFEDIDWPSFKPVPTFHKKKISVRQNPLASQPDYSLPLSDRESYW